MIPQRPVAVFRRPALRPLLVHSQRRYPSRTRPSTIDSGFILSLPKLPNPATSDPAYRRVLEWYLPSPVLNSAWPRFEKFGEEAVSNRINTWIADAENNPPYVKTRNVWVSAV